LNSANASADRSKNGMGLNFGILREVQRRVQREQLCAWIFKRKAMAPRPNTYCRIYFSKARQAKVPTLNNKQFSSVAANLKN
jgi:hypothetical protein